ncbi:unnamed protein product [Hapterophycus canaliculatus]
MPRYSTLFRFYRQVVGDSALLELANGCDSSLAKLDLSGCSFVSDHGMLAALLKCPGLEDLTLSGCGGITDQARASEMRLAEVA